MLISLPTLFGQESGVSPYSRFGLGDPNLGSYSANFGMSGLSIGVLDNVHINPNNAAALPFLTTPGFDVGMLIGQETASTSEESVTNSYGRLDHFVLGMPFSKGKWGTSLGIRPYSVISYQGSQEQFIPSLDITQESQFAGQGGLNDLHISLARKFTFDNDTTSVWNNNYLSLGLTMNWLFGSNTLTRSSIFPANSGYFNTRVENTTTYNDVALTGSALYRMWVNEKKNKNDHSYSMLTLGVVGDIGGDITGFRSQEAFSYSGTTGTLEFEKDSINSFEDCRGTMNLPSSLGVGASMEFHFRDSAKTSRYRRLRLGVDYRLTNWSDFALDFGTLEPANSLTNSSILIFGAEYTPSQIRTRGVSVPFFPSSTYRIGARAANTHLLIDNQQLTEYGISFGASFPILTGGLLKSDTKLNFGVEYGTRGSTDNGLIEEQFTRVMVGFSFHPDTRLDRWFQRSKYD
jgi:hypothetical protein